MQMDQTSKIILNPSTTIHVFLKIACVGIFKSKNLVCLLAPWIFLLYIVSVKSLVSLTYPHKRFDLSNGAYPVFQNISYIITNECMCIYILVKALPLGCREMLINLQYPCLIGCHLYPSIFGYLLYVQCFMLFQIMIGWTLERICTATLNLLLILTTYFYDFLWVFAHFDFYVNPIKVC